MFQDGLLRARGPSSGPFISGFKTPNSHCPFCRMILTPLSLCAHPLLSSSPPYFLKFYLLLRSPSVSLTSFLFLTSSLCIFPHLPSPSPSPSPSLIPLSLSYFLPLLSVSFISSLCLTLLPFSPSPSYFSFPLWGVDSLDLWNSKYQERKGKQTGETEPPLPFEDSLGGCQLPQRKVGVPSLLIKKLP